MLAITDQIAIADGEFTVTAIRAQGAGGQNVNKVASAIQLRFAIPDSSLPPEVKARLLNLGDKRVSQDGVLIIKAQEFRTQNRNLMAAKDRLATFIRRGLRVRKRRKPTTPSKAAIQRRLENKRKRGEVKANRRNVHD